MRTIAPTMYARARSLSGASCGGGQPGTQGHALGTGSRSKTESEGKRWNECTSKAMYF